MSALNPDRRSQTVLRTNGFTNGGVIEYNTAVLKNDPVFHEIMNSLLAEIVPYDSEFLQEIKISREKLKTQESYNGLNVLDKDVIRKWQSFDLKKRIYLQIRAHLQGKDAKNAEKIEDYFLKILLQFHDDATASIVRKKELLIDLPKNDSLIYAGLIGVEEPQEYLESVKIIRSELLELSKTTGGFRADKFRLGYYHQNGAMGLAGIASENGFVKDESARAIGFIESKFAALYKVITASKHRTDFHQNVVFDYLRKTRPLFWSKYMTGAVTFEDIMGTESLKEYHGVFEELMTDPGFMKTWRDSTGGTYWLKRGQASNPYSRPETVRSAILYEKPLWLDMVRVVNFHRSAAEKVVETRKWIRSLVLNPDK